MNVINNIERWGDTHHPKWVDFIRVLLGIFLFLKGVEFINNMETLTNLMAKSQFLASISLGILAHYIVLTHLVAGAMITAGLLTRLACLTQIPILIGAVFLMQSSAGILAPYSMIWLSVIVLLLLIYFLVSGSGPLSVDEWMRKQPNK
ncbi:MAG: DoxX family protein [Agriterribacter sp.]